MLDIGFQELLVIMVLALLVFGPEKLPELGRKLGRAMREFRRASDEFRSTVETNLRLHEDTILPPSASDPVTGSPAGESAATGADSGSAGTGDLPPVDGRVAETGAAAEPGTQVAEPLEPFWSSRGGRLLHRSACAWRTRVPEADRVPLKAAADGWDMGLLPCPVCDPRGAEPVAAG